MRVLVDVRDAFVESSPKDQILKIMFARPPWNDESQ